MRDIPAPVVNGCYVDQRAEMYKVVMLSFSNGKIHCILAEDTGGHTHQWRLDDWLSLHLIPCCLAGKQAPLPFPLN